MSILKKRVSDKLEYIKKYVVNKIKLFHRLISNNKYQKDIYYVKSVQCRIRKNESLF